MDPSTATKLQIEAYQKMSGEERLQIALILSDCRLRSIYMSYHVKYLASRFVQHPPTLRQKKSKLSFVNGSGLVTNSKVEYPQRHDPTRTTQRLFTEAECGPYSVHGRGIDGK